MRKSIITSLLLFGCATSPVEHGEMKTNELVCGNKPNCVSSVDNRTAFHLPPFQFEGNPANAMNKLVTVVKQQKRTTVQTATDTYLHAVRSSAVFRFKDDLFFVLDPEQRQIHFKSAARTGYSDFGVNRKHIENIRRAFNTD